MGDVSQGSSCPRAASHLPAMSWPSRLHLGQARPLPHAGQPRGAPSPGAGPPRAGGERRVTGPGRSSSQDSPPPGEGPCRCQGPAAHGPGQHLALGRREAGAPGMVKEGPSGLCSPHAAIPCGPSPTGPGVASQADRTGSCAPVWTPSSHEPVSHLPSPLSVPRSGCPSDRHHHRLPHHGHSCSDHNSCLKKLVRVPALLVWKWRLQGVFGGWGCADKRVLLLTPGNRPQPGGLFLCARPRAPPEHSPAFRSPHPAGWLRAGTLTQAAGVPSPHPFSRSRVPLGCSPGAHPFFFFFF